MKREDWGDLAVFAAIADERSFTRAAARLGVSASALSHTLRGLEERLGVRLLSRTTRSVAPTEAGERLLATLRPSLDDIAGAVERLGTWRDEPSGPLRLTVHLLAMRWIMPHLPAFARAYPRITLEIAVDNTLTDVVTGRYDAGVRYGEFVPKDMVSVRISPDERGAIVAAPDYFERFPAPRRPRDLAAHRCIVARLQPSGPVYRWELERNGRVTRVTVPAVLITNDRETMTQATLAGMGLGYMMESDAMPHLRSGALVRVMEDWCPPFAGSVLYYPNRRQVTPALRALIDVLRYPAPRKPSRAPRAR